MNPIFVGLAAIGGYLFLSKGGLAGVGSSSPGPIPTTGARTPPQPGKSPAGATDRTAQIVGAGAGAVKDLAGAFVSIWDALSTSQEAPPDPAPVQQVPNSPSLSGGAMAGSDWAGWFAGGGFDPGAGDALFAVDASPAFVPAV